MLAPPQEPEELGRLGAYPILQVLGTGGMGAVFRGRDNELGRDIAVKVILEKHHDQAGVRRRFLEEAQICGRLQHPGVVPVYEVGTFNDQQPYFTMKLVQGQTLAQLLKDRPTSNQPGQQAPDLPRFVTIFGQVCQAMAYAHDRGVIHRDLKPANIMVGTFGEVQVMDWGLAKNLKENDSSKNEEQATNSSDSAFLLVPASATATGSVLGTPSYMPPEQARGEIQLLDQRCDVFALGAILCQILTGTPPYESPAAEQARRGSGRKLSGSRMACGADTDLIDLAWHCLQPNRADRLRDAGEVAAAVTGYQESVQARAEQERQRAREVAQARAEEVNAKRRRLHGGVGVKLCCCW